MSHVPHAPHASRAHEAGTVERDAARNSFVKHHGWAASTLNPLPADMSFRRYFRLNDGTRHALLMDSPPDKEDIRPFVKIALHLRALGFSTPNILSLDEDLGFAVIEDFGNNTYANLINSGADQHDLYGLAVDALAALHNNPQAAELSVPDYNINKLVDETCELVDWYYPALTGAALPPAARQQYIDAWQAVFAAMPKSVETLTLRDFHIDNLMLLEDREAVARCGILDFQDAVIGHPAYDLVSLLEDARRDLDDNLVRAMQARYAAQTPDLARSDFDTWYQVLGVQRHAKVAGRFTRFYLRDSNPDKLCHIPRVMNLLTRSLDTPALQPVKSWLDHNMPNQHHTLPDFNRDEIRALICPSKL